MKKILTVEAMRCSDAAEIARGTTGRELMYRAGNGIFQSCSWNGKTVILAGGGNNAGDGYVLAKLLKEAGVDCRIILCSDAFSADGRYYFQKCEEAGIPITKTMMLSDADILVDCLLGTGFHGALRPEMQKILEKVNAASAYRISVDINSGMHGDTGMGDCIQSDLTVSIGFLQLGHLVGLRTGSIRQLYNIHIGIPCDKKYLPLYLPEETPVFDPAVHEIPSGFIKAMTSADIPAGTPAEQMQTYALPLWDKIHFKAY